MAKAKAYCKCSVCGETFLKEKDCHNRKEADSWEEYAVANYDLCGKCWYKQQKEQDIQKGLYVDIRLNTRSEFMGNSNENEVAFIFGGDTYPHKDVIKALGGTFEDSYPFGGLMNDLIGAYYEPKRWVLFCSLEKYKETLEKVKGIGAKVNSYPSKVDTAFFLEFKNRNEEKRKEKEGLIAELGPIPPWPDEISKIWPTDTKWNGKFYGKNGCWRVFFSGNEVHLSDELKKVMEETFKAREGWRNKKKEIENKYI